MFLDIDMPRMDGIDGLPPSCAQTTGTSTRRSSCSPPPATTETEARGAAGADLFLTKPFSPLDLLRLVDRIGRRGAA